MNKNYITPQTLDDPESDAQPFDAVDDNPFKAPAEVAADEEEWIDEDRGPFGIVKVLKNPPPRQPSIEAANTPETEPFQIGQLSTDFWGRYTIKYWNENNLFSLIHDRMALPKPRYPSPGERWPSLEVEDAFNREYQIYRQANFAFQDLLQFILANPDEDNPRYSDESVLRAAENRKFLEGLWTAKNYKIPTWSALLAMAQKRAPATPEEVPQKSQHYLFCFEGKTGSLKPELARLVRTISPSCSQNEQNEAPTGRARKESNHATSQRKDERPDD